MRTRPLAAGPEVFDLALTAGAFDQELRLILLDEGVYWLTSGLPELVTEAIEQISVERESLRERAMEGLPLPSALGLIDRQEIAAQIAAADVVVGG